MRRKKNAISKALDIIHIPRLNLLANRGYLVDGEDLPDESKQKSKAVYIGTIFTCSVAFFGITYLKNMLLAFKPVMITFLTKGISSESSLALEQFVPIQTSYFYTMSWTGFLGAIVISIIPSFMTYKKLSVKFDKLNYGQKGDNRLATTNEIMEQYPGIPDKKKAFDGIGGVLISHFKNQFYIDRDTVNTCYLGTSRSGKGEMFVTIMIDILSRAREKCSMVLSDPKGELYAGSKETLEKRGFEVQVLNILDPMQSMSYNPLQLIVEAWQQGDKATAQMLVNTFSYAVFNNPNAGPNQWVYQAAQKVVNGVILALIDECDKNNELEKVTLYNVGEMVNELSSKKIINPETGVEISALDEYFNHLPQGNMAKGQYASATVASEKSKGTILQTVLEGLTIFQMETIAKMTSKNSFNLKSVGFPKSLFMKFDKSLFDKDLKVGFYREDDLLAMEKIRPNLMGVVNLNFNVDIRDGDTIEIVFQENGEMKKTVYSLNRVFIEHQKEYDKAIYLEKKTDSLKLIESIDMQYSEKPIAVFLIIPDYDPSRNIIASTFIKQLYTTLAQNASVTRGKKCHRRVHMILDEFGNIPPIESMDNIMTVCLGRNILFNLFLQSYSQLEGKYGKHTAETIKENCQNHVYIMSGDGGTHKEISAKVGRKTVEVTTINDKTLDINTSRTKQVSEEQILTTERISTLLEGETIVIRTLHRRDNKRRKIRPFPIFNTKETSMPFRYEFLSDDFDMSKDINDFRVSSEHTHLDLKENSINFELMLERVKNVEAIIQSDEDKLPPPPVITEGMLLEFMVAKGFPEEVAQLGITKVQQNFNEEFAIKDIIAKMGNGNREVEEQLYKYVDTLKNASHTQVA